MKFQIAVAGLVPAFLTAACPTGPTRPDTFTLRAVSPGSEADGFTVQASRSNLLLNAPDQAATCAQPLEEDVATFFLRDGGLYLYATDAPQAVYTDRSGMGMSSPLPSPPQP